MEVRQQRIKEAEEEILKQAEEKFKNGKLIDAELFVKLCDKYNIKLPLKTRGGCLKTLAYISKDNYKYKKGGNTSTVIYNYVDKLMEVLTS